MYAKYCGVPKQEIDVCPTVGWIRDFADPLTVLYVPFYGPAIVPTNNSNWSQVNDPPINEAMDEAELITNPTAARRRRGRTSTRCSSTWRSRLPEDFDNQPNIKSTDVAGINDALEHGSWDFDFTSLK